jgi:DNA-binding transcriptional MocR family regulator
LQKALHAGVAFVAGSSFYPAPEQGKRFMRLNFTMATEAQIDEGIARLSKVMLQNADRP